MPKKHSDSKQEWTRKLQDFQNSTLTAKQWCEQNHERISTFKYWKYRIRSSNQPSLAFEELKPSQEKKLMKFTIQNFSVELPVDADKKMLKSLIQAMHRC